LCVRMSGMVPRQGIKSRRHLIKVAVLAVVFVTSVVGGNVSLRFIPVSFNQAIGATTPFFTALLSLFIMRQKETFEVYLTLIPIVLGAGSTAARNAELGPEFTELSKRRLVW
jgi:drug/metabolite transporter (DMT)-like permease